MTGVTFTNISLFITALFSVFLNVVTIVLSVFFDTQGNRLILTGAFSCFSLSSYTVEIKFYF